MWRIFERLATRLHAGFICCQTDRGQSLAIQEGLFFKHSSNYLSQINVFQFRYLNIMAEKYSTSSDYAAMDVAKMLLEYFQKT